MPARSLEKFRLGRAGERIAARYLENLGYDILGRDIKLNSAEIDILARDGGCFVLVEVKTLRYRKGMDWTPVQHFTEEQKKRQYRARKELMRKFEDAEFPFRHDFIGILMGRFIPRELHHVVDFRRYQNNA